MSGIHQLSNCRPAQHQLIPEDEQQEGKSLAANVSGLPSELWLEVAKQLTHGRDVAKFASTCKVFRSLIESNRELYLSRIGFGAGSSTEDQRKAIGYLIRGADPDSTITRIMDQL